MRTALRGAYDDRGSVAMNTPDPSSPKGTLEAVGLAIAAFGIMAYRVLPVSDLPTVDFPTIQVQASLPGGSPPAVSDRVRIIKSSNRSLWSSM